MSAAVQAVSDFPWGLVNFIGLIVLCAVVWRKGWLGTKNEAAIKAEIAKIRAKAEAEVTKLESQLPKGP